MYEGDITKGPEQLDLKCVYAKCTLRSRFNTFKRFCNICLLSRKPLVERFSSNELIKGPLALR